MRTLAARRLLFTGVLSVLLSVSAVAMAGAESGEFLGYRIGSRYPITNATKLMDWSPPWAFILEAERPTKPGEFGPVYLVVTKKTFTVLAITSSTELSSQSRQLAFANKYLRILGAQYPDARRNGPLQVESSDTGRSFDFGPADTQKQGYWLYVDVQPDNPWSAYSGRFPVHIGLTHRSNRDLDNQAWRESAERDKEDAAKKGLNRGL